MTNKRYEQKTVPNYIGQIRSGPLNAMIGYSIREGWTNPNNNKNLRKAGFFHANEVSKSNK